MRHDTKKFKDIKYWLNYSHGIYIDYDTVDEVYRCRMFTGEIKGKDGRYRLKTLATASCPKQLSEFVDDLRSTVAEHAETVLWRAQVDVWKIDDLWWDKWSDIPENLHCSEDLKESRIRYNEWIGRYNNKNNTATILSKRKE